MECDPSVYPIMHAAPVWYGTDTRPHATHRGQVSALHLSSIVCSAGIFHDKIFYELLSCMFSLSPSKTISQEVIV